MSHPLTISKNVLKVYHNENIRFKPTKRILSINLNQWKENLPKKLIEICIDVIASNWEVLQLLNELPLLANVISLLDILRVDLPLKLTVPKIAYEVYWLRCYKERWPKNSVIDRSFSEVEKLTNERKVVDEKIIDKNERKTWKELYLEKHVQEYLENLDPEHYDVEKINDLYILCKDYVTSLNVRELRAPTSINIPDHVPLNTILMGFSNMRELSLCFKQKYVGEKFSWHIFNTTMIDIKNLSKGLETSKLEILRIQNSDINCIKLKMILKSLDTNDNLKELEFSHCKIADHGAMAISNFIKNHVNVTKLNLVNNYIDSVSLYCNNVRKSRLPYFTYKRINNRGLFYRLSKKFCFKQRLISIRNDLFYIYIFFIKSTGYAGIKSLAFILMEDDHLNELNVRLNIINSKGGKFLFYALTKGKNVLKELNLSGCGLNRRNVEIDELLRSNETLEKLNLSNNRMGKEIEKLILSGLQFNTTLINLDCRRCEFSSDEVTKIFDLCEDNKRKNRSKEVCWDPPQFQFRESFDEMFSVEFQKEFENILID
ncbi:uncharacterized protein [Onthophagus taurus]|uniref:uncharacterized protein n=1 Tax=Onthophagus taurus TaxID=166361 RepID=UPI0039BE7514